MNFLLIAVLLSAIYVSLDLLNFKVIATPLYNSFYTDGVTNYYAAALVYLLYPLAVMYLTKGVSKKEVLGKAAALGATGYGLYHLTNMATMKKWPVGIAAYDTLWGVLVTIILAFVNHKLSQK